MICLLLLVVSVSSQQLLSNDKCNHLVDRGQCNYFNVQWYYDRWSHRCRQFYYGGCEGNENRFNTQQECEAECRFEDNSLYERCSQPYDPGHCHSDIPRIYFDMKKGSCVCTSWTGCGGNNNMFHSIDHCMSVCGPFAKPNQTENPVENTVRMNNLIVPRVHAKRNSAEDEDYDDDERRNIQSDEGRREFSSGSTHIIRHGPDGSKVVKIIKMHPVELSKLIMDLVESKRASSLDEAIRMIDSSSSSTSINNSPTSKPLPNYVYLNERRPLSPIYRNLPQININNLQRYPIQTTVTPSFYRSIPKHHFIRPVDPEERRKWKEEIKRSKKIPPRRLSSTYYEVITTTPSPSTTSSTTPFNPPRVYQYTPSPIRPTLPPSNFYQEAFDLAKLRRLKDKARKHKHQAILQPTVYTHTTVTPSPTTTRREEINDSVEDYLDYQPTRIPTTKAIPTVIVASTVPPPRVIPTVRIVTTPKPTVLLPVSKEDLPPTHHTLNILPNIVSPTLTHFDLAEGRAEEEEDDGHDGEYEDDADEFDSDDFEITQKIEDAPTTTTTVPPPTRPPYIPPTYPPTIRPTIPPPTRPPYVPPTTRHTPPPRVPYTTVSSRLPYPTLDPRNSPLNLIPPSQNGFVVSQTTSSTTTTPEPEVTPSVRKSIWDSYDSYEDDDDFDVVPASKDSMRI